MTGILLVIRWATFVAPIPLFEASFSVQMVMQTMLVTKGSFFSKARTPLVNARRLASLMLLTKGKACALERSS
jgi:hypothetical protein